jgi:hypothetical protein
MNEYAASHFDYYDNTLTDGVHLMLPLPCNAVWSSFQIFLSPSPTPLSLSLPQLSLCYRIKSALLGAPLL